MKTRSYTVHVSYHTSCEGLVLVKEGFCWLCFFATVPWALFHRMWFEAAIFAFLQTALVIFCQSAMLTVLVTVIALIVLALVFGYLADEIRRSFLERQGYQFEEVVLERNIDSATQRTFVSRPDLLTRVISQL
tara:strand:- start:604 stop:1002 length:399 start_codon:yes stop_codon:yes gene_type:complete